MNIVGVADSFNDIWSSLGIHALSSGQNAYLKIYNSLKVPLDLFPVLPVYQLQFGPIAKLPYVDAYKFGLEQHSSTLCVTDYSDGKTVLYRASLRPSCNVKNYHISALNCDAFSLSFIVEFDLSDCESLTSDHLEHLATVCLSLQRLRLFRSVNCLKKLQGLQTVANCCHSLQGLDLVGIRVTEVENHIQLWEILSSLKLTHLVIGLCNMLPFEDGDTYKSNFIKLYQKCLSLQALHFKPCWCTREGYCGSCKYFNDNQLFLLSYFPSLAYCQLDRIPYAVSTVLQHVTTSCKKVKCLKLSESMTCLSVLPPFFLYQTICSLQQLYIDSQSLDIPDTFMGTISAHGGLVHVFLSVKSVKYEGVVTLIANSPKLQTYHVIATAYISDNSILDLNGFKIEAKKKFSDRRLCNSGSFEIEQFPVGGDRRIELFELKNIDVTSYLWYV